MTMSRNSLNKRVSGQQHGWLFQRPINLGGWVTLRRCRISSINIVAAAAGLRCCCCSCCLSSAAAAVACCCNSGGILTSPMGNQVCFLYVFLLFLPFFGMLLVVVAIRRSRTVRGVFCVGCSAVFAVCNCLFDVCCPWPTSRCLMCVVHPVRTC